MDTLAALCDILDCTPNDLIEIEAVNAEVRKTAGGAGTKPGGAAHIDPQAQRPVTPPSTAARWAARQRGWTPR